MGKKKTVTPIETTAITLDNLDNPEAIAAQTTSIPGLRLIELTEKELENRQQLRLQLIELEKERQQRELGDRRLMQVLGFVIAVITVIIGCLIAILNREIQGAITGGCLGLTAISCFLLLQIRLLKATPKRLESDHSD